MPTPRTADPAGRDWALWTMPDLIWLAIRLVPADVLADCRRQADEWMRTAGSEPTSRAGAALIVLLWLAVGFAVFWAFAS